MRDYPDDKLRRDRSQREPYPSYDNRTPQDRQPNQRLNRGDGRGKMPHGEQQSHGAQREPVSPRGQSSREPIPPRGQAPRDPMSRSEQAATRSSYGEAMPSRGASGRSAGGNSTGGRSSRVAAGGKRKKSFTSYLFSKQALIIVASLLVLMVIGGFAGFEWVVAQGQNVDLNKLNDPTRVAVMFDSKGKQIDQIGLYHNKQVSIDDINKVNPLLPEAFVRVEDIRFYEHDGVDYQGIARSIFVDLTRGGAAQGGGTITMQLARNMILNDHQKTLTRKATEIATAWQIEQHYSKKQILGFYLNNMYFGNHVSGVWMAAKLYFNKDILKDKLTPGEVAFLAGLPKAPSSYNPFGSKEQLQAAINRRSVVLMKMAESDVAPALITEAQREAAAKDPKITHDESGYTTILGTDAKYTAYEQVVMAEITSRYGIAEGELATHPYRIYTGLDTQFQDATEKALQDDNNYMGYVNGKKDPQIQLDAGSATIDVNKGLIIAIGGGRKFKPDGFVNGAYQLKQPGSTVKPILVYGPAIEKGLANGGAGWVNPNTILPGYKMRFGGTDAKDPSAWTPKNFDNEGYPAYVTMDYALKQSVNVPAAWTLANKVGVSNAFNQAQNYDLPVQPGTQTGNGDRNAPALALGGWTKGVTPVQLARAYTTFPKGGSMVHAYTISKIELNGTETHPLPGKELNQNGKQIFSPTTTWWMTQMLMDVVKSGTAHKAMLGDSRQYAGKTGTVSDNTTAWFSGFTPSYVTTVMVFNTQNQVKDPTVKVKDLTGGTYPSRIFRQIMDGGLKGKPIEQFQKPSGAQDPPQMFQLAAPQVTANYDPANNKVTLNWNPQEPKPDEAAAEQGSIGIRVYNTPTGAPPPGPGGTTPPTNPPRVTYQVFRSSDGGKTWGAPVDVAPGTNTYDDTNLGTPLPASYTYKVVATDTQYPWSGATPPSPALCTQQTIAKVDITGGGSGGGGGGTGGGGGGGSSLTLTADPYDPVKNSITLHWNADPTTTYQVLRSEDGGNTWDMPVNLLPGASTYTDDTVQKATQNPDGTYQITTYSYKVVATGSPPQKSNIVSVPNH